MLSESTKEEMVDEGSPGPATEASRLRLALARALVAQCPNDLGCEIAVTGSVARGVADDYSDVELNLWVDDLPAVAGWRAWLERVGVTDLGENIGEMDAAGFCWTVCRFEGVWIEIGWAQIDRFEEFVRDLAGGVFISHERLQMGWTISHAILLRTQGRLADWRSRLARYPDGLAERIMADQTEVWADPHVPGVRWALAARRERMGLALRFVWDMQNLLRVLFAVNHTWDHDLKWTDDRSLDLPLKPMQLSARINAIFALTDLERAVETNQRLIVETLELARDEGFDVSAALRSMQEGLRAGLKAAAGPST